MREFWKGSEAARENATLDLSKYKSPAGAAKALYKYLVNLANEMGYDGEREVFICNPKQSKERGYSEAWMVSWESGPFEWAVPVSLGSSMFAGELGYSNTNGPEIFAFSENWFVEPWYSFDLYFHKR